MKLSHPISTLECLRTFFFTSKTKTCAPLALHEDHKPGNTYGVPPASHVQQCFSKAALHGHERSRLWNISLLERWCYDVIFNNVNSCLKGCVKWSFLFCTSPH